MKNLVSNILNILFFAIIAILAVSVATIALTKKVNEYREQSTSGIKVTVQKQIIPILSQAKGIVESIEVKTGQQIRKNEVLVKIDNPLLRSKYNTLKNIGDNVSAQTEAKVAEEELDNLNIISPVDGTVGEIFVTSGGPVDSLSKVMTIYSGNDIRLLAELTTEQYQQVQKLQHVKAYSPRLNQTFPISVDILRPDEKKDKELNKKLLGLYLTFVNPEDGKSLLDNEDLELKLVSTENHVSKPIDFFVNFWNSLLSSK